MKLFWPVAVVLFLLAVWGSFEIAQGDTGATVLKWVSVASGGVALLISFTGIDWETPVNKSNVWLVWVTGTAAAIFAAAGLGVALASL